jgi:hypothetical protein
MKRTALILVVVLLLPTGAIFAQGGAVEHNPTGCIRADAAPLMQVSTEDKGELRAYFRRVNTTDWCSVEGKNLGQLSNVVLPKFDLGDEIEYFFVVLQGKRVVAKSPRVYRAKATDGCDGNVARHMLDVQIDCSRLDDVIPAGMAAGFSVPVVAGPSTPSPERPAQQ